LFISCYGANVGGWIGFFSEANQKGKEKWKVFFVKLSKRY